MIRRHGKSGAAALLLAGLCLWMPGLLWAGSAPLTSGDIETTMAVREKADAYRLEALDRASRKPGADESFAEMMVKIQRFGREADQQACEEHGISVEHYQLNLRRLIAVGELVFFEEIKTGLEGELRQRQAKTEADLVREAEQTRASTEQWFGEIQSPAAAETDGDQKKPVMPEGYSGSLEQIVVEPIRQQAADGALVKTVRKANQRRIEEIRQQLAEMDRQLSTRPMRQAVGDKQAVLALVDRMTLQTLSTSLVEEIPTSTLDQ